MTFADTLRHATESFCTLSDEQMSTLEAHYHQLVRWNRRLNLTSVIDMESAILKHYAESLFLGVHLPSGLRRVADIGSGAGFPGVPIAILRPEVSMTLVESDIRKSVFLKESTSDLPNTRILTKRAEDLSETFDCLVTRAVSPEHVAKLVPKLAPRAFALAKRSMWNLLAVIPWDSESGVVFHVEHS